MTISTVHSIISQRMKKTLIQSVSGFIDKYEEQDDFVKLANDIEKNSLSDQIEDKEA